MFLKGLFNMNEGAANDIIFGGFWPTRTRPDGKHENDKCLGAFNKRLYKENFFYSEQNQTP